MSIEKSPEERMDELFDRVASTSKRLSVSDARIYQCSHGMRTPSLYGSFKAINKQMFRGRRFEIVILDGNPSVTWLDVVHDEKTYKSVPAELAEYDFEEEVLKNAKVSNYQND